MNTNARLERVETGAVKMPGRQAHGTAPQRQNASCRILNVEVGPRSTSWCHGGRVRQLLDRVGVPTMYDRQRRAWAVPTDRLGAVIAGAERTERRTVTVKAVQ